jgi:succinate dehydrogenase/fumarate reductase flavoprotein subunit
MADSILEEVDVIVVGSGAAGLTTAVVAAQAGLKVLVTEKTEYYGGTTALSLGAPWIIANHHQRALGISDDAETGKLYLRETLGSLYDPVKVAAYIDSGAEMISFLEDNTQCRWNGVPMPDYFPDNPGSRAGRTLLTRSYDGSVLGLYLRQLRPPLPGFSVFGGMQIDLMESTRFKTTFTSLAGFRFTARRMMAYGWDRLRFQRGTYLANGNALVGRLLRSALDAKVHLWRQSPVTELIVTSGVVSGATIQRGGELASVRARRGVVLASGGFGANADLRAKYIPYPNDHISVQPDGNVGDGLRLGQDAGGALGEVNPENGVWAPVSVLRRKDGSIDKFPHFGPDRGKPGSIVVDSHGKRFVDEACPYQQFVHAMHERGVTKAYFIGDRRFLRAYGMGFALPAPYPIGSFIRNGYLIEASSLEELAKKIALDPQLLVSTVAEFNRFARLGQDPEFHRGENAYDQSQGDFDHKPNPNLGPIDTAPYYAVVLHPGDVSTVLGMQTNADAQVLSPAGGVIGGLYAVGLDQNSMMRGVYPGGGSGIGPGMTFGYRAARHLSATRGSELCPPREARYPPSVAVSVAGAG